jgi:beta-phosphoglucomutase-like phosphatase (HAD superfamily)
MSSRIAPGGGVIFDMDGLMLDTERVARIAWREAARLHGHQMTDELFVQMIGRPDRESMPLLIGAFGPTFDFEAAGLDCGRIFEDYIAKNGVPLKPGVREVLEQVDLMRDFATLTGGDEVPRGKPAPDIYKEAARRTGIDPAKSYALEDSHAGVRAAHAAGFNVIMVPDLLPATPEIAALTCRVAASLRDAQEFLFRQTPFEQENKKP